MKLETTFLRSKLARRIFWLFVLCALFPISVLAIVSLRNVTAQLNEQSRGQLHWAAREEAMGIYERLTFLEADMKLIAFDVRNDSGWASASPDDSKGLPSNLVSRFKALELVTPDGHHQSLFGRTQVRFDFTDAEQKFLSSGKSILSTIPCDELGQCILLSRRLDAGLPGAGTLVAELEPSYLWDSGNLPQNTGMCVLDPAGRTLFCSAGTPHSFPSQVTHSFSGEFEEKLNGSKFLAHYWNLPLASSFFEPHWTIVTSEAKPDVMAPLTRFRTSFTLVLLLALWVVLLLSLVQIRRNLTPLAKLKEGTNRISLGNFHTRVSLDTGDEFEELAGSFNSMAARIERQLNSLKVVNEIDRAILSAWDIERIVDTLSNRLGELLPLELVAVNLFDSGGSLTALTHIYGPALQSERLTGKIEVTADEVRELSEQPGVSVLTESDNLPSYLKPLRARGMRYFLRAPILLEGRVSAIFTLGHASACAWNEEDKEHARQLADQVAVALSNSHLVNDLQQLNWGTLTALARAIDAKSPWTLGHSERVTSYAIKIAKSMGLPSRELDIIRRGGLLHDIGKIGTPAAILDKAGKLTDEEMKQMCEHVNIGARILQPIPGLAESMSIVLQHHEWVNGKGYPNGLAGEEITLHARIFAVADCFDALVSDRPYRPGMPVEQAMHIIGEGAGKQFDPQVVNVLRRILDKENIGTEREEPSRPMVEVN